jgi:hypothetical protein
VSHDAPELRREEHRAYERAVTKNPAITTGARLAALNRVAAVQEQNQPNDHEHDRQPLREKHLPIRGVRVHLGCCLVEDHFFIPFRARITKWIGHPTNPSVSRNWFSR